MVMMMLLRVMITRLAFQRRILRFTSPVFNPEHSWTTTHSWLLMEVSLTILARPALILIPVSDVDTCSLTPPAPGQRWWQVQVRPSLVSRVLVLASAPATLSALAVFVIELVPGTKAEYRRCGMVAARRGEYAEYECHGVRGEFVYIRCGVRALSD